MYSIKSALSCHQPSSWQKTFVQVLRLRYCHNAHNFQSTSSLIIPNQCDIYGFSKTGSEGAGRATRCWGGSEVCACVQEACRVRDCAAWCRVRRVTSLGLSRRRPGRRRRRLTLELHGSDLVSICYTTTTDRQQIEPVEFAACVGGRRIDPAGRSSYISCAV